MTTTTTTNTGTKPHAASVAEAVSRAQAERLRQYSDAVRATAEGRDVDPEQVAALLDRLGIDVGQFTADAEAVAARIAADKGLKEVPAIRARAAKLEAERDALDRELAKIQKDYHARIVKLNSEAAALATDALRREAAHRLAFEVVPYPGVKEAHERARAAVNRARAAVEDCQAILAEKLRRGHADAVEAAELTLAERRGELADAEAEFARTEAEMMRP